MAEKESNRKERKQQLTIWLKPSLIERIESLRQADNCESKSEFIEKAVLFYVGYLASNNAGDYMPRIIVSTLKGIVDESDNRINRILFKLAVEQAISMNVIAATCNISREQLDQLRAMCVNQVKKTNGSYSFQDAYDLQKK